MRHHKSREKFLYTDPCVEGCIKGKNGFPTILQLWTQLKISKNKSLQGFLRRNLSRLMKNITHFSKQSNHMMLRSVIHIFVEYRRLRIFYLVTEKNYLSVERYHKKRMSWLYSNQRTNENWKRFYYKRWGFVISPYFARRWKRLPCVLFNRKLMFLKFIFIL